MADIFISYASEDRARVAPFARALGNLGWDVWWDRAIPPGKTFDEVIEEAINAAKCVVVLWSGASVKSSWVKEEASIGKRRKILVPAKIDPVDPPLGFTMIQAADLTDWTGGVSHAGFTGLTGAIAEIVGPPKQKKEPDKPEAISIKDAEPSTPESAEEIEKRKAEHPSSEPVVEESPSREKTPAKSDKRRIGRKIPVPVFAAVALLVCLAAVVWFYLPPGREDPLEKELANSIGMKFALIPAGSFTMGSPESEEGRYSNETQHPVTITRPFYMQTTEVTQGQWKKMMGGNPSYFKDCDDCTVETVSWDDAQDFIEKLNAKEGVTYYRLPTEAEWEYAVRAGTTTAFSFGDDEKELGGYAWYSKNSSGKTHPVGTLRPNAWGLYDMHGNVWEWVEDDWHDNYNRAPKDETPWVDDPRGTVRVLRGGSWGYDARFCRSAFRSRGRPDFRSHDVGFRLARSVTLDP